MRWACTRSRALPVLLAACAFLSPAVGAEPNFHDGTFTISAWVKPVGDGTIFSRCAKAGEWSRGGKALFIDDGVLVYDIGWVDEIRGDTRIRNNRWSHVVFTGASPQRLYIDGKLEFEEDLETTPDKPGHVFKLGSAGSDFGGDLRGLIDDVAIYNRVLSGDEIAGLAAGRKAPREDLVALWRFEEHLMDLVGNCPVHLASRPAFADGRYGKALQLDPPRRVAGRDRGEEAEETPASPVDYSKFSHTDPRIGFDKLLFVKRQTYHSSHFYTDFIDGCSRFGGNLCILDLPTGKVTDLVPGMSEGIFGRFDLHFNADRIVFDWKKEPREGFRIYEIRIDPEKGTPIGEPRQVTFRPDDEDQRIAKYDNSDNGGTARMYYHQTDDMHPCYLPDGGIVFVSTRPEYGTLCDAPDHLTSALMHRVEADGSNIRRLSNSAVSEFSPSMMEDGRILYTRWEYVDKGQLGVKCLWAMRPDGSGSVEIYGNDIRFPPTFLHGRQVPGKAHLVSFLGTPHFPQSGIGTVILADLSKDIRTREPMNYITPNVDVRQEPGWNQLRDGKWRRDQNGPLYMDPFPLSERDYLVSHNPDKRWDHPTAYGLYLLAADGEHALIHDEADTSCWQPTPLLPRQTPPVLNSEHNPELARKGLAECLVQDVHFGMEEVGHGEVKFLRVMEQVPRPWDSRRFWDGDAAHTDLVGGPSLSVKVMWGVVPVEKDGSAHFYVPANRNIYLQALDQNYRELQRERTYVNYMPGETRSCIGCHEQPRDAPPPFTRPPIAMAKAAVMPGPQPGDTTGRQVIHFPSYIQPILDAHCISCHGEDGGAGPDLRGTDVEIFSRSWKNLLRRNIVPTYGEASDFDGTEYVPAKTIGSHKSRLFKLLEDEDHDEVKLSQAELVRFATWIDASGVFYGSYWGRRHVRFKDHPNYRPTPTFEQAISTVNPTPKERR